MHIIQAALIVLFPASIQATPTLALRGMMRWLGSPQRLHLTIAMMILTAALALVGALARVGRARLSLLIPQHFILGVMALGGWWAAWHGVYLDGTPMDPPHIVVDQITVTALWIIHTHAILRRTRDA